MLKHYLEYQKKKTENKEKITNLQKASNFLIIASNNQITTERIVYENIYYKIENNIIRFYGKLPSNFDNSMYDKIISFYLDDFSQNIEFFSPKNIYMNKNGPIKNLIHIDYSDNVMYKFMNITKNFKNLFHKSSKIIEIVRSTYKSDNRSKKLIKKYNDTRISKHISELPNDVIRHIYKYF